MVVGMYPVGPVVRSRSVDGVVVVESLVRVEELSRVVVCLHSVAWYSGPCKHSVQILGVLLKLPRMAAA